MSHSKHHLQVLVCVGVYLHLWRERSLRRQGREGRDRRNTKTDTNFAVRNAIIRTFRVMLLLWLHEKGWAERVVCKVWTRMHIFFLAHRFSQETFACRRKSIRVYLGLRCFVDRTNSWYLQWWTRWVLVQLIVQV